MGPAHSRAGHSLERPVQRGLGSLSRHGRQRSEPKIEALGVTDYFCIDTYKEVRKREESGRLPDVQLVFPNVELRIDTKTADERVINIHLLFSPADPNHEAEIERILSHLQFDYGERWLSVQPCC